LEVFSILYWRSLLSGSNAISIIHEIVGSKYNHKPLNIRYVRSYSYKKSERLNTESDFFLKSKNHHFILIYYKYATYKA